MISQNKFIDDDTDYNNNHILNEISDTNLELTTLDFHPLDL